MSDEEIKFTITHREPGHAQVRVSGTYTGPATVEHVRKQFYHEYFGGHGAWCEKGRFGAVRYTD